MANSSLTGPYGSQYLGTLGLGLLQAAQPQPYGANRMSYIADAMAQANQGLQQSQMLEKRLEQLDTSIARYKGLEKERKSKGAAISRLVGGYDPQSDINWSGGRAEMSEGETMANLAQAVPEQFAQGMMGQMFPKAAERTGAQKDAIALGFQPGTPEFNDYVMKRTLKPANSTTVNVENNNYPKVPGFAYELNPDGTPKVDENGVPVMNVVPGGPADMKQKAAAAKDVAGKLEQKKYADIVTEDIDRAIGIIEGAKFPNITVTGLGSLIDTVPLTDANNLRALMGSVKAAVSFDRLQEMRKNSPTGGALGQVSNLENQKLEQALGALDQSQTDAQLLHNLQRVKRIYTAIANGVKDENGNYINPVTNPVEWERKALGGQKKRLKYNEETGELE